MSKSLIENRVLRVFVSSTFRDMQEDRDYLVKFVFPQLRKLCESRGVTWGEVDLRWGITDEEAAEGKVLPLCLEEIQRCRPYFIGLLGERYGWVPNPEEIPVDLVERQPWLKDHREHSVTELEIIHGVLREEKMHLQAFFYFRDPKYVTHIPEENRHNFTTEDAKSAVKLKQLKQRLRAACNEEVCELRESYCNPKQLGDWILEDFNRLIDDLYPNDEQPGELDREAAGHEAFARTRAGVYIGRQDYFDRLDAHVSDDGRPLAVCGDSGIGKSALLANWFLHFQSQQPDAFTLIHFIGSTADSADAPRLMQRIMLELKRFFKLPDDVPSMPDQIRDVFPQWLDKVAGRGRIVIVLDALNQLDDRDHAPELGWLPAVLPPNIRLIVSTLPGRSLDAVQRRDWPEMTVKPLTVPERCELIEEFLVQFGRRLSVERVGQIAGCEQSANPLFLRAVLDELRQFGEHERLGEMINHYLAATNPGELYLQILQRWEDDYGRELVRNILSLLGASRRGLSESELLDLLGTDEAPLPRAKWTPFHLAAESVLSQRSGLLRFFHSYIRDAVHAQCLPTEEARKSWHRRLAAYWRQQDELSFRALDELPWQWLQAEEWDCLKALLTERYVFLRLRSDERGKQDLQAYWLELKPHHDPCDAYRQAVVHWESALDDPRVVAVSLNKLGDFHLERAEHRAAEPQMRRALAICEKLYGAEHPEIAANLNNLAMLFRATNRPSEAEPLFRRALAIDKQTYGAESPEVATSLNNLAVLLQATNRTTEAETLYRQALAIDEQADHSNVARDLNNLAELLRNTNRQAEAEPLYRRALGMFEQTDGAVHPNVATGLNNLAQLLQDMNILDEAEPLMRRALAISEKFYGVEHPEVARNLNNLAELLRTKNQFAEAEPLYRRALAINEQFYGGAHPEVAACLNNLALLLNDTERLAEAEPLYRRALATFEHSGDEHPGIAFCLNNLATLLYDTHRLGEAESMMRRMVEIFLKATQRTGHDHPLLQSAASNYVALLEAMGKSDAQIQQHMGNLAAKYGMSLDRG